MTAWSCNRSSQAISIGSLECVSLQTFKVRVIVLPPPNVQFHWRQSTQTGFHELWCKVASSAPNQK